MADQNETTATEAKATNPQQPAIQAEHMVPITRFNEVNEERRNLFDRLARMETEQKAEIERRLIEQNQYKELAETRGAELVKAQAEAQKVQAYETTLKEVLNSQINALPEDKRALVPDELTTAQKLNWLAKNAAILKAPIAFDIGAGRQGGSEQRNSTLSPEEAEFAKRFGMTPEEYIKYR